MSGHLDRLFTGGRGKVVSDRVVVILTGWSLVCVGLGFGFGYMAFQ